MFNYDDSAAIFRPNKATVRGLSSGVTIDVFSDNDGDKVHLAGSVIFKTPSGAMVISVGCGGTEEIYIPSEYVCDVLTQLNRVFDMNVEFK